MSVSTHIARLDAPVPPRSGFLWAALNAVSMYLVAPPILLLHLALVLHQEIAGRITGIPGVRARNHFIFDRAKLPYLTPVQRVNCFYCSYANGVGSYLKEILARTEQYWCPIKHERPPSVPHSRYWRFVEYGDEAEFRRRGEAVSSDFSDLEEPR